MPQGSFGQRAKREWQALLASIKQRRCSTSGVTAGGIVGLERGRSVAVDGLAAAAQECRPIYSKVGFPLCVLGQAHWPIGTEIHFRISRRKDFGGGRPAQPTRRSPQCNDEGSPPGREICVGAKLVFPWCDCEGTGLGRPPFSLFIFEVLLLLLTLGMSLIALLGGILSVLLGRRGVFLPLCVIALTVMLSCSAM
jgi:hypothetical protein